MKKHFNEILALECETCQHCYKCVRSCPTNAIKIVNNNVEEDSNLCIDCGKCNQVCHKGIHNNPSSLMEISEIINTGKTIALLDTTFFINGLPGNINQITKALLAIGFDKVETAFDGFAIHTYLLNKVFTETGKMYFNNNCVPFTNYVRKYYPQLTHEIFPYLAPTEISAILKKEKYGDDFNVILISNCFGDFDTTNLKGVDNVLLSADVLGYLQAKGVNMSRIDVDHKKQKAFKFAHMSTIEHNVITGLDNCVNILEYATKNELSGDIPYKFFLCTNSCFGSTAIKNNIHPFEREQLYLKFQKDNFEFIDLNEDNIQQFGDLSRFELTYQSNKVTAKKFTQKNIKKVFTKIGINEGSIEYNCGGCGFNSCNEFAHAILDDRAIYNQCTKYLTNINNKQSEKLLLMVKELNQAFSLTIPDERLEKKLKTTPLYRFKFEHDNAYAEVLSVIEDGLYKHIINCLQLAAEVKDCKVFDLIGINKSYLVQAILYHCNAKTQPILQVGDIINYFELIEDKKEEALRSAIFAERYYNLHPNVIHIIKYHKHSESELGDDFPKSLLPTYRLFKLIDIASSYTTKNPNKISIRFEFTNFMLFVVKTKNDITTEYMVDLYREHDFDEFSKFINL